MNEMTELNAAELTTIEGGGVGDFLLNIAANAVYEIGKAIVTEYLNSTGSAGSVEDAWRTVGYEGAH